jgi:hypothetical protein
MGKPKAERAGVNESTYFAMGPLAYVSGVEVSISLGSELRGRLWFNHFGRQSLFDVGHALFGSIGRRADLQTNL